MKPLSADIWLFYLKQHKTEVIIILIIIYYFIYYYHNNSCFESQSSAQCLQ